MGRSPWIWNLEALGDPGVSPHFVWLGLHITGPASPAWGAAAAPPLTPTSLWPQSTAVPGRRWSKQGSLLEKLSLLMTH